MICLYAASALFWNVKRLHTTHDLYLVSPKDCLVTCHTISPGCWPYRTATRAGPEGQWHEETRNKVYQSQNPVDLLQIDHRTNCQKTPKWTWSRHNVAILLHCCVRPDLFKFYDFLISSMSPHRAAMRYYVLTCCAKIISHWSDKLYYDSYYILRRFTEAYRSTYLLHYRYMYSACKNL